MIIDCISDLHGHYPKLEGGDLLIVAGDLTSNDEPAAWGQFLEWLASISILYHKIIIISGNHDNALQYGFKLNNFYKNTYYLCDSGVNILFDDNKPKPLNQDCLDFNDTMRPKLRSIKVWGSPWTLRFERMNPNCMAFTVDTEQELAEKWALIPSGVDILITHSPIYGILDKTKDNIHAGSFSLLTWMIQQGYEAPKVHICGHIHEAYGFKTACPTQFINASHVNERYEPVNKPIRIEL